MAVDNLPRETEDGAIVLSFFARNPLKRPNSEK